MAVPAMIGTEPENAISRPIHFQRLADVENGGTSVCRGKRYSVSVSLSLNPQYRRYPCPSHFVAC